MPNQITQDHDLLRQYAVLRKSVGADKALTEISPKITSKTGREAIGRVHKNFKTSTLENAILKLYQSQQFFKNLDQQTQKNIVSSDADLLKKGMIHPGIQEKIGQLTETIKALGNLKQEVAELTLENKQLNQKNTVLSKAVKNLSAHLKVTFGQTNERIAQMAKQGPQLAKEKKTDQSNTIPLA